MTFAFKIILERCSKLHSQLLLLNWKLCNGNLILREALLTNWKPWCKKGVWAWHFFSKMWISRKGMTHNFKKIRYVEMTQVCILFSSLVHEEWASQNPSLNPSPYPFDFLDDFIDDWGTKKEWPIFYILY